jgi:hypothetical protein
MISNRPVSTVSRYSASAQNTIHAIGKSPKQAPYTVARNASVAGMP